MIPDNIMCATTWGKTWLFKHQDYLNVINILGVFSIIPMAMFLKQTIQKVIKSRYLIPILTICILMCVQMTIFSGDRALSIISFLSVAYIET
jgi:Ca2+/Na+ antiporter